MINFYMVQHGKKNRHKIVFFRALKAGYHAIDTANQRKTLF